MANWQIPEGITGEENFLRFRPSIAAARERSCPLRLALKVRPDLARDRPLYRDRPDYSMGPFHNVLDRMELDGEPEVLALSQGLQQGRKPVHPALARWTEHAVRQYLNSVKDSAHLEPVSRDWVRRLDTSHDGIPVVHEETVTGRRFEKDRVRELRILRMGSVEDRPRNEPEIALAAAVLAEARPALSKLWKKGPATLGRSERPHQVRVVEIGCLDGTANVLFDDTPEAAIHKYQREAEELLRAVAAGNVRRPGTDCAECPLIDMCPAVPSIEGLLGVNDASKPLRTWSLTTTRQHRKCGPIPYYRDLKLPRDGSAEQSPAVERGHAVHEWIEVKHLRSPQQACRADDVPDLTRDERFAEDTLQAKLGMRMIGDHSLVCPFRDAGQEMEVYPEHPIVVYDPAAQVVVIDKVDLLYLSEGVWRLRETKTSRYLFEGDLLKKFPQIALAIVLSAEGALGGGNAGCRVELERLTANGPVLTEFDVHNSELVAEARKVIQAEVAGWHSDLARATKPGKECRTCVFTRWCPDAKMRSGS
ncbi:PD-(D/E)XK nuclease family protein [Acrocarpospora catenulata]|uniref:PD-(D/E)XK nuclease family protein n=1 Tax=Acrocarpospora catenulata TaxID=2836182 RepID=UPI001BDAD6F6|nr:PD-(D/E)XK nuclease family protein [Acrocarpospora catenulata]